MIDPAYVAIMAHYTAWQNASLTAAASTLDDGARRADQGAFFGSIHGTLCHLLWGDTFWMSRFDGWAPPPVTLADSAGMICDWDRLAEARSDADARIRDWAGRVDAAWLAGDVTWFSGLRQTDVTRPAALCVMHFFNHQTHHRGQAHALLTAAGARPEDTDLVAMPAPA